MPALQLRRLRQAAVAQLQKHPGTRWVLALQAVMLRCTQPHNCNARLPSQLF